MATNGVVHLTISDDLEGISSILRWLSYVHPYVGGKKNVHVEETKNAKEEARELFFIMSLVFVQAYYPLIGPLLNELCLGIQANGLAKSLSGVYAKDLHACLTAIKCIPSIPGHVLRNDALIMTSIWIAWKMSIPGHVLQAFASIFHLLLHYSR
ncbi:hypothetical protein ZIOFF_074965 [Zingiber officinale]|uniref:CoA carboxyltransferase N-terminal domain-containing protein n=1 Tax=Zingiber officinale TaxID=94328 RepID=A0A8J5ESV8_ZINOF|nr:hypothetical protein ZIOFF_074965 [Zingiber officinale]